MFHITQPVGRGATNIEVVVSEVIHFVAVNFTLQVSEISVFTLLLFSIYIEGLILSLSLV
jgi:hypothetical protein